MQHVLARDIVITRACHHVPVRDTQHTVTENDANDKERRLITYVHSLGREGSPGGGGGGRESEIFEVEGGKTFQIKGFLPRCCPFFTRPPRINTQVAEYC